MYLFELDIKNLDLGLLILGLWSWSLVRLQYTHNILGLEDVEARVGVLKCAVVVCGIGWLLFYIKLDRSRCYFYVFELKRSHGQRIKGWIRKSGDREK